MNEIEELQKKIAELKLLETLSRLGLRGTKWFDVMNKTIMNKGEIGVQRRNQNRRQP